MTTLTHYDVKRLLTDPSATVKAELARKIADQTRRRDLTPRERELANDIVRVMIEEADVGLRTALSECLKDNPNVPPDIAAKLAKDVENVAIPMLHTSLVFSDSDLIDLVRERPVACQIAIARRRIVSETVSQALAETGDEAVTLTLLNNPGARITESTMSNIVDLFSGKRIVMDAMARRPGLTLNLAERLIALVSANLREGLVRRVGLDPGLVEHLLCTAQENSTFALIEQENDLQTLEELARQLHGKARLTCSLLLRAICIGRLDFLTAGLAVRADVSVHNAHRLLWDDGPHGLASLCRAAGLPRSLTDIVRIAIGATRGTMFATAEGVAPRIRKELVKRLGEWIGELDPAQPDSLTARLARWLAEEEQESPPEYGRAAH